jgi:hypothetical protein
LGAITDLEYAADEGSEDYDPDSNRFNQDIIATIRSFVNAVCFFLL